MLIKKIGLQEDHGEPIRTQENTAVRAGAILHNGSLRLLETLHAFARGCANLRNVMTGELCSQHISA